MKKKYRVTVIGTALSVWWELERLALRDAHRLARLTGRPALVVQLVPVYRVVGEVGPFAPFIEVAALSDDEVTSIIESAFEPLACIVQVDNEGKQVRFKVMSEATPIYVEFGIGLDGFRDMAQLKRMLSAARQKLIAEGYSLDPLDSDLGP